LSKTFGLSPQARSFDVRLSRLLEFITQAYPFIDDSAPASNVAVQPAASAANPFKQTGDIAVYCCVDAPDRTALSQP
jgi:hypothetical protein